METALTRSRLGPPAAHTTWWWYSERHGTHEVLAEWDQRAATLRTREMVPSAPRNVLDETAAITRPWEVRVSIWLLEARLTRMGDYVRACSMRPAWVRLPRPAGAPAVDTRQNEVIDTRGTTMVHHYHDRAGSGDTLLAALHTADAARLAVLRARLDVPGLDIGRIDILHTALPSILARSLVLREELTLAQSGLPKLVNVEDYRRAFGDGSVTRANTLVSDLIERVRKGALERPEIRPEDTDVYAEFLMTINDPRLHALHARFLKPDEEEQLLAGGVPAIQRAIAQKRANVPHSDRHLMSLLEASLLARARIRSGQLVRTDPEVRALTRLAYYL